MFGLPNGNPLSEVVLELTRDHPRCVGELSGTEPPLLRLLEVAIKADTSGASGGSGRSVASAPLDVTALSLWEEIREVIGNHWPGKGDLSLSTTHMIDRLEWWTNSLAGSENEAHLLEYCVYWRTAIRDLLEPPTVVELRGVECPDCKTRWLVHEDETGNTYKPPLRVHMSETPVRVECLYCDTSTLGWESVKIRFYSGASV